MIRNIDGWNKKIEINSFKFKIYDQDFFTIN